MAPLSNEQVIFLNKTKYDPFYSLNNNDINKSFTDYQKEFYEMIFNYKTFFDYLNLNSNKLRLILNTNSNYVKKILFFDIYSNAFMIFVIIFLLYIYLICFESILIKVLNKKNRKFRNSFRIL